MYSVGAYYLAKSLVDLPFQIIYPTITTTVIYCTYYANPPSSWGPLLDCGSEMQGWSVFAPTSRVTWFCSPT